MNIDERLEKLAERHEALSQTLELMAHMHRDFETAQNQLMRETGQKISALAILAEQNEVRAGQMQAAMTRMMESIDRLAHIADIHEHRITGLESQ